MARLQSQWIRDWLGPSPSFVNSASEIVEAHLPQCYVPVSMEQPAQVLIVVLDAEVHAEHAVKALQEGMRCLTFRAAISTFGHCLQAATCFPLSEMEIRFECGI